MPRRRALRFVLEVIFLVAMAVALTAAHLRAPVVVGVMALGWLLTALFEWAAWLDTPHFGRGLPPRYYVPQVSLPPGHPVEQESEAYPQADEHEEEQTWIAPPAAWGEVLEDWPVLGSTSVEETGIAEPGPPETPAPDEAPLAEEVVPVSEAPSEPALAARLAAPEEVVAEAVAEPVPEPVPELDLEPVLDEPAVEDEADEEADDDDEVAPGLGAASREAALMRPARHRIDPLAVSQGGRFRRRRSRVDGGVVEVPDRPPATRALPGRAGRDD